MTKVNLLNNYVQLLQAIEYCIKENLLIPALILIYSAIDSASWVADKEEKSAVSDRFQKWVNDWMLDKYPLPCNAEELYAARCGILHTLTPQSSLSEKKGVRKISYAWGKGSQEKLEKSFEKLNNDKNIALHIEDLFKSFRLGFADFVDMMLDDESKEDIFSQKADMHFTNLDMSTMDDFLRSTRKEY